MVREQSGADARGAAKVTLEADNGEARAEIGINTGMASVGDSTPNKVIAQVELQFRNHAASSEPDAILEILAKRLHPETDAKNRFRGIECDTEWVFTVKHKGKQTTSKNPGTYVLPEGEWSLEEDRVTYLSRNTRGPQRTSEVQQLWADWLPDGSAARTR